MQPLNDRRQLRIRLQPMPPARRATLGLEIRVALMLLAVSLGLGGVVVAVVALLSR